MTNRFSQMGSDSEQEHQDNITDEKGKEGDDDAWVEDALKKGMERAHKETGGTSDDREKEDEELS